MKTDMRLPLISMLILFAVNTEAATVGWWRFDDYGTNAHKTVASDSFSNHVDSTKFPMYPKTFNDQTEGTDETYMPTTTNTFGKWNKLRIYDPVSDTTHFVGNSLATTWGGDGSKQSGGAVIADNPALRGGSNADGSFTWECIFKADANALMRSSSMSPLLGQKSDAYDGCWSLMPRLENGNVSLWCRGKVKKNSDGTLASACTTSGQPPYVTPDVWHHAALSFDGSTGQFRIYLDYTLVSETSAISGGGRVAPGNNEKIYIAKGRYTADRSFLGEIAEVRCSDTRLTENDFLRFDEVYLGDRVSTDSDTVFWYSLDSMKSFESFLVDYPHLATTNGHPERVNFCAILQPDEYTQAGFTDSVVNAAVRPDLRGGPVWTNTASLAIAVKDGNPNSYIKVSDPVLMIPSDDFTEEFYFKTYSAPASGKYYGLMYSSFCKVLLYPSGGILVRTYCDEGTTDHSCFNINLCDGNYHHYAFGYKASEKKIYIYLDHALQGSFEGTLPCKKSASTAHVVGQARENPASPQVFDGEIDELRLTRRLLTPDEFIGRGSYFNTNVIAHIRFDGDYSIWPWIGDRLNTTPHCAGAPANTIVNDVKAGKLIIKNEAGEELQLANTGSTHTWGGGWCYNNIHPDIAQSNVTIEFFWKACEKHAPWFTVVGVTKSATYAVNISDSTAPWVVGYSGTWDYSQLALRMTTKTDSKTYSDSFLFGVRNTVPDKTDRRKIEGTDTEWAPCKPDGKWHHIAITFEELTDGDGISTKATVYWDYEKNAEKTLPGTLNFPDDRQSRLCGRGYDGRAPEFLTDEIRITKGILQPKDFMRLKHLKGGCILLW